jgi:putative addiction module component (TIGR02574 family)
MKLADFPELVQLSPWQRLQIAEELWDSAVDDKIPVPVEHKKLVRSRRAAYERGEMPTVTMSELKRSVRRASLATAQCARNALVKREIYINGTSQATPLHFFGKVSHCPNNTFRFLPETARVFSTTHTRYGPATAAAATASHCGVE